MPARSASARWEGKIQDGKGTINMGAWQGPYSFASRFEDGSGTNPEELIAAAHAGCFSMAFSAALGRNGFDPKSVATSAKVHLAKAEGGFEIPLIELDCEAEVPGIDEAKFQEIADGAKKGCPISKALGGVKEIKLTARNKA
jgi:osmotically inducible protein OsmC